MEWDKFWSMNKKKYEQGAHRYMGVFKDTCVELHIENAPEGEVVSIPVALHPKVNHTEKIDADLFMYHLDSDMKRITIYLVPYNTITLGW